MTTGCPANRNIPQLPSRVPHSWGPAATRAVVIVFNSLRTNPVPGEQWFMPPVKRWLRLHADIFKIKSSTGNVLAAAYSMAPQSYHANPSERITQ